MRSVRGLLLFGIIGICCMDELNGRTRLTNTTDFELKAIVEWAGGRGGRDGFPGGTVDLDAYKPYDDSPAMMSGETHDTGKDWADLKTRWIVWAKVPNSKPIKWVQVIDSHQKSGGNADAVIYQLPVKNEETDLDEYGLPHFGIHID